MLCQLVSIRLRRVVLKVVIGIEGGAWWATQRLGRPPGPSDLHNISFSGQSSRYRRQQVASKGTSTVCHLSEAERLDLPLAFTSCKSACTGHAQISWVGVPPQKADHPFGQCVAIVLNCTLSQYLDHVTLLLDTPSGHHQQQYPTWASVLCRLFVSFLRKELMVCTLSAFLDCAAHPLQGSIHMYK